MGHKRPNRARRIRYACFSTSATTRASERLWSPNYIQHSAHTPPGRDGLFGLIKPMPATLRYENHLAAATGDFVILHGRFSGFGAPAWVVADIVRMENGLLAEHWDVIQDEVKASNPAAVCRCSVTSFRFDRRAGAIPNVRQTFTSWCSQ